MTTLEPDDEKDQYYLGEILLLATNLPRVMHQSQLINAGKFQHHLLTLHHVVFIHTSFQGGIFMAVTCPKGKCEPAISCISSPATDSVGFV